MSPGAALADNQPHVLAYLFIYCVCLTLVQGSRDNAPAGRADQGLTCAIG
jgi:hypothetical protein